MVKGFTALTFFILFASNAFAVLSEPLSLDEKIAIAKKRCTPPNKDSAVLYRGAFRGFNKSIAEIDALYSTSYERDERLANRLGYFPETKRFFSRDFFYDSKNSVEFTESSIKSIILHIENSLKLNYVKYIFFPDMGHSHLFIPLNYYEEVVAKGPSGFYASLELALKAPNLKTLYHTAEQFALLGENKTVLVDRYLQWRFYTRNPVIDALGNIEIHTDYAQKGGHNTVRNLEGHRYYSGYNISANKNGCFPFEDKSGKIQYFDISAWDLPYKSAGDDGGTFFKTNSGHQH